MVICLLKGITAGLWVDLEAAWLGALGTQPAATCKRTWGSAGCNRRSSSQTGEHHQASLVRGACGANMDRTEFRNGLCDKEIA